MREGGGIEESVSDYIEGRGVIEPCKANHERGDVAEGSVAGTLLPYLP
jgi:hypothetical protein